MRQWFTHIFFHVFASVRLSGAAKRKKDALKTKACREAVCSPDRFSPQLILDEDLQVALEWMSERLPEQASLRVAGVSICSWHSACVLLGQVAAERERIMAWIESLDAELRSSGEAAKWPLNADPFVAQVRDM